MKVTGEVAAPSYRDGQVCSHAILPDERSCYCGVRVAVVVADLQLAFFEWPRTATRFNPRVYGAACDGVVLPGS